MEKFRKYLQLKSDRLDTTTTIWVWVGRIAPLTALLILGIAVTFDLATWVDYVVSFIAVSFAITAFTWWWWVIYAVRDIFKLLKDANKRFESVILELKEIKKEYIFRNKKK